MPFSPFNGKGIKFAIYTNEQAQSIEQQKQQQKNILNAFHKNSGHSANRKKISFRKVPPTIYNCSFSPLALCIRQQAFFCLFLSLIVEFEYCRTDYAARRC